MNGQASNDELLKREIRWDPNHYLNIWVVDGIGISNFFGELGYAYLPCTGGLLDGIVVRKDAFGTIGAANANPHVTHELGHCFGLNHTWGPTNTPGQASSCGIDDGIADTPNTIGTFTCNLAFTFCTDPGTSQPILANVQSFMDYNTCFNMFTTGQRAVMRAALTLGCRSMLTMATNLLVTGTNDSFQPPAGGCPLVSIGTSPRQLCVNQSGGAPYFVGFGNSDALNAAGAQVQWAFPGGVPANSTSRIERVSYNTPGIYPVTLTIMPAGGPAVARTEPNWMQVGGPGTGLTGSVNELFETPGFLNNFGPANLRNWVVGTLRRPTIYRWQRASGGTLVAF
ncbi:MAG: M43 family zinc metalloprotease [Bacteroidota bacterium]|nr:M43 family zinc metalloprotease [Bacteroidota bacterium]